MKNKGLSWSNKIRTNTWCNRLCDSIPVHSGRRGPTVTDLLPYSSSRGGAPGAGGGPMSGGMMPVDSGASGEGGLWKERNPVPGSACSLGNKRQHTFVRPSSQFDDKLEGCWCLWTMCQNERQQPEMCAWQKLTETHDRRELHVLHVFLIVSG